MTNTPSAPLAGRIPFFPDASLSRPAESAAECLSGPSCKGMQLKVSARRKLDFLGNPQRWRVRTAVPGFACGRQHSRRHGKPSELVFVQYTCGHALRVVATALFPCAAATYVQIELTRSYPLPSISRFPSGRRGLLLALVSYYCCVG